MDKTFHLIRIIGSSSTHRNIGGFLLILMPSQFTSVLLMKNGEHQLVPDLLYFVDKFSNRRVTSTEQSELYAVLELVIAWSYLNQSLWKSKSTRAFSDEKS